MTLPRGETGPVRVERFAVRWSVEPATARRLLGAQADASNGASAIELCLTRGADSNGDDTWTGDVVAVLSGERRRVRHRSGLPVRFEVDASRSMMHIDAEGFVHATVEVSRGEAGALLYVRTPMLTDLGFSGGRYQPEGVTLGLCASQDTPPASASPPPTHP